MFDSDDHVSNANALAEAVLSSHEGGRESTHLGGFTQMLRQDDQVDERFGMPAVLRVRGEVTGLKQGSVQR